MARRRKPLPRGESPSPPQHPLSNFRGDTPVLEPSPGDWTFERWNVSKADREAGEKKRFADIWPPPGPYDPAGLRGRSTDPYDPPALRRKGGRTAGARRRDRRPTPTRLTLDFYDTHAADYVARTADLDMTAVYKPFLSRLPAGGEILDAGCGSGRDAAAFAGRGYRVTAMDGSAAMARLATERTGLSVLHLRFEDVELTERFDGVWACGSVLHVPSTALASVLARLVRALRHGGSLYLSVKQGEFEGEREGRWFRDASSADVRTRLTDAGLIDVEVWESPDARGRATTWINALGVRP